MTVDSPEFKDIPERLAKLEKQNRRLQGALLGTLIVFSTIILMGQAAPSPRILEAQKFVLKDGNGNVRGWMGVIGNGSELNLGNANQHPMISLEVSNDAGDLHFYGSRRSGMNLGINSGHPSVSIVGADGVGSTGIAFGTNGPSVRLEDANGFATVIGSWQIENADRQAQQTTAASLVLLDRNKKVLWKTP